jgi:hypothetical protein
MYFLSTADGEYQPPLIISRLQDENSCKIIPVENSMERIFMCHINHIVIVYKLNINCFNEYGILKYTV